LNHLLEVSQYSSEVALPVPDHNDLYLERREGLYLVQARGGRRGRTLKFSKWQCQQVFQCFWHCRPLAVAGLQQSLCQVTATTARYSSLKSTNRVIFRSEGVKFAAYCLVPKLEQPFHTVHSAMSISEEAECRQPPMQWQDLAEGEGGSCLHLIWAACTLLQRARWKWCLSVPDSHKVLYRCKT